MYYLLELAQQQSNIGLNDIYSIQYSKFNTEQSLFIIVYITCIFGATATQDVKMKSNL